MLSAVWSRIVDPVTQRPRNKLFWIVLGGLVAGQLLAVWLLCSHQVRKAEARRLGSQIQQMALADCLQYITGSTIASCSGYGHMPPSEPIENSLLPGASAQNKAIGLPGQARRGANPVSYSYR